MASIATKQGILLRNISSKRTVIFLCSIPLASFCSHSLPKFRIQSSHLCQNSCNAPVDEATYLLSPALRRHCCTPGIPLSPHLLLYIIARTTRCRTQAPEGLAKNKEISSFIDSSTENFFCQVCMVELGILISLEISLADLSWFASEIVSKAMILRATSG